MATKELADSLPTRALASALARSPARRIGLPGQAFMEMALGMLALALVLASLFGFTSYILSSLEMQRDLRADAGRGALEAGGGDESYSSKTAHDVVEVEQFAADYVFGSSEVEVQEEVHIPAMA
ncbi:MAG: hypothetical protein II391_02155, partial [Kiritimatiellae bacterium]|nr:hypothetical protein [Kiritimatiellia bacterium]